MSANYSHKQSSGMLRLAVIAPAPFLLLLGPVTGEMRVTLVLAPLLVVLALVGLIFTSLTIEVDERELIWFFGPGVWRKRISRAEIVSALPATNPWWYGWGIHKIPNGWLYNVGGLDAVEVLTKDGRKVRLGTDEPDVLAQALATREKTGY